MHVAINAHLLAHTRTFRRAGVSNYVEALLIHLGEIDQHNQYTVYTTRGLDNAALGLPPNFRVRPSRFPTINPRVRVPWEQALAPALLRISRADVYHGVLNVIPLACPVPSVVTIHDLSAFLFPQTFRRVNRIYTRWAIRVAARRARYLLAVSEFTKREIVRWLHVSPERIVVTPNAADARFAPPDPATLETFRRRAGLPERFVLFLGTLEPRKNLTTLLEAYARIARDVDAPLIIGGAKGWLYEPILARAEQLGLGDRLRFVGYIDQEDQALWYAAATIFVFPSLYEGFGMPPLEAMACGTPVIVSNSSSLPEVVGATDGSADQAAALIVPPTDAEALAAAMLRLLSDAELRAELRARGLARARCFSWRTTAERTLDVYQAAARG
ncbi:MAG: glycosyltransferase family 4 protein [Roseiflexus sp.]|nr:glycosyltransferase family 4 protein [Roseiflexus sp.]MCS7289602.1 glycosyltransferase family 4 protein [Roseiflexus sp.]MDW8146380.1 glycosyltransferase family 1 protein [Roseiflexaceae bacterium]